MLNFAIFLAFSLIFEKNYPFETAIMYRFQKAHANFGKKGVIKGGGLKKEE